MKNLTKKIIVATLALQLSVSTISLGAKTNNTESKVQKTLESWSLDASAKKKKKNTAPKGPVKKKNSYRLVSKDNQNDNELNTWVNDLKKK